MYKDMTFGVILERMLDRVPNDIDKREGSIVYDALAPAALELARFYSALDNVIDETFADTAGREMLVRRAAERGIIPFSETFAIVRGEFNTAVPIGARFSINELRYAVTERISETEYRLTCEAAGSKGNLAGGDLLPVDYIERLTSAKITGVIIPGEDDEDTEHLRKRYFDSIETRSYGGNVADYRRAVLSIQGVGGVKVFPVHYGPGSVRLVIQDYRMLVPSAELLSEIKNILDPEQHQGLGYGLVPIGHAVTVEAVTAQTINISAHFKMERGYVFGDIRESVENILDEYFKELSAKWDSSEFLVVNASQIETRILNMNQDKISDISNLKINNSSARSEIILADFIPLRGDVTNVE